MSETTSNYPGVFRGNTRLASQQDISALKEYVERLIAGPINEIGENGYIPWKYTPDGSLDIEYLFPELLNKFAEQTGITVDKNGIKFAENITSINFQGKYVTLDVDENGHLVCTIDEPSVTIPNFNDVNMFGSAVVKIDSEIISDMIVPDTSHLTTTSVYGDWAPGKKVRGINWNKNTEYDQMVLTTQGPVYTPTLSSYFEVRVTDGAGSTFASFISTSVSPNLLTGTRLPAASSTNSPHVGIYITDFKEEAKGYSFMPRFEINLVRILGQAGGRFNVRITHHCGGATYEYLSEDLLYNYGLVPTIATPALQVLNDENSSSSDFIVSWCSGIKYIQSGIAYVCLNNVYNLNKMAAVENPIEYDFAIGNEDAEVIAENYDYKIDKIASFKIKLKLNKHYNNNSAIAGRVTAKNAFGVSQQCQVNLPILLKSEMNLEASTALKECFTNEAYRVLSDFTPSEGIGEYVTLLSWDSEANLTEYDRNRGLMVIPGIGLRYPYGNWTSFVPVGNPDYSINANLNNEKYFCRVFTGNNKVKYGGVFKFEGLSKTDFLDDRLSLLISCSQGAKWYNLKTVRNMYARGNDSVTNTIGVMTALEEYDGGICVHWSYPTGVASSQQLYFKIGMKQNPSFCIKSITLLNTDMEEDW